MNAVLIDIFYREQAEDPAKWLMRDLGKMKLDNCLVFCFSGHKPHESNFYFYPALHSKSNEFTFRKYQKERSKYLLGEGPFFTEMVSKTQSLLTYHKISKLFIFGNNFHLAKKLISLGFDVSNFELGPTRKPYPKFLIFKGGYNKWSQDNIYSSFDETNYSSESDLHNLSHGEIPLQLAYDSSFFPESSFLSMLEFIKFSEKFFLSRRDLSIRLKSHPGISSDKIAKADHKNVLRVTKFKKTRLFIPQPKANFILTLSSTYALEQAINGKPYFHFHDSLLGRSICYEKLNEILYLKKVPKSLCLLQQTRAKEIYNSELSLSMLKIILST